MIQAFDNVSARKKENYLCWTYVHNEKLKVFLQYFMRILNFCAVQQKIWSFKPWCAPASPAAHFLSLTARIRQDISAASFAGVNCADAVMSMFYHSVLTSSLIFLQLWIAVL